MSEIITNLGHRRALAFVLVVIALSALLPAQAAGGVIRSDRASADRLASTSTSMSTSASTPASASVDAPPPARSLAGEQALTRSTVSARETPPGDEVQIGGEGIDNGTTYEYRLDSLTGLSPYEITFTGHTTSTSKTKRGTLNGSTTVPVTAGNVPPGGPNSASNPVLSIERGQGVDAVVETAAGCDENCGGDDDPIYRVDPYGVVYKLEMNGLRNEDNVTTFEVWVGGEFVTESTIEPGNGRFHRSYEIRPRFVDKEETIDIQLKDYSFGSQSAESSGPVPLEHEGLFRLYAAGYVDYQVTGPTGETYNFTGAGTKEIELVSGSQSLDFAGRGPANWTLRYQAKAATEDPAVTVNGNTASYDGILQDGETVSLNTETSWLREGTNRVTVTTRETDVEGLTTLVDMEYRHGGTAGGPVERPRRGVGVGGPTRTAETGLIPGVPDWIVLLSVLVGGIAVLGVVSNRSGASSRLLVVGAGVLGLVGIELTSPGSTLASAASSELATIVAGVSLPVGLWGIDQRTAASVPFWLVGFAAVAGGLWIVETIAPGAILGALSAGLEQVSPVVWLALVGGGGYLLYQLIQARRSPDTRVTFDLGNGGQ